MAWWKTLAREPLVHFVLGGAVLFAVDHWRSPAGAPTLAKAPTVTASSVATARIVVDAALRAELTEALRRRADVPPTAAEIDAAVERWIDEEVLYREATQRGLDRDDPIVHQRIAAKMSFVVEQGVTVGEPSEPELKRWFAAHRERWATPDRFDFTHVFVAGSDGAAAARADGFRAQLEAGASPDLMGDRFTGGRRYRGRKLADLSQTFGEEFVPGLDAHPLGRWFLHRSRFGLHLVRIDHREGGRDAEFAVARPQVRTDWLEVRRAAAVADAIRALREQWQIVRP